MKCVICGADMEMKKEHDYEIWQCPKCKHEIAIPLFKKKVYSEALMEIVDELY